MESAAFCHKCGAKVAADACPSCGYEVNDDVNFCPKCGTVIKAVATEASVTSSNIPAPEVSGATPSKE